MLKNIIYAVLLGIGMAACLSQQEDQDETATDAPGSSILPEVPDDAAASSDSSLFVIENELIGKVRIGMPINEMRAAATADFRLTDTTLTLEGMPSTAYILRQANQAKGLLIEQTCDDACKVWRISVLSPTYKTAKGIHVGSTYGELQQAHKIRAVTFEEGRVVAQAPDTGMSFILDHGNLSTEELSRLNAATTPKNLLIEQILVY